MPFILSLLVIFGLKTLLYRPRDSPYLIHRALNIRIIPVKE
jgi:hypothetical protein